MAASYKNARGWLTEAERDHLVALAQRYNGGTIINIGVEYGASLACLRHGAPHAEIIGIDIDTSKAEIRDGVTLVEADSGAESLRWPEGDAVDLAFIDGDHSYAGVWRDLHWTRFIPVGGTVSFHDCYSWGAPPRTIHQICPEVDQAVSEWYAEHGSAWKETHVVDSIRTFERIA